MPIEREVKFLMQPSATADWLAGKPVLQRGFSYVIQQIYVSGARMRAVYDVTEGNDPDAVEINRYEFAWKHSVEGGRLEVEIKDFPEEDFAQGARIAERCLWKRRDQFWYWQGPVGLMLELDSFFVNETGETYLTMIEVEYKPGQEPLLEHVEKLIASRLRARIALDDTRFDNYRLADPDYTRELLAGLGANPNTISLVG